MTVMSSAYFTFNKVKIHQLSFGAERANTYIIGSNRHAILIDICSSDVVNELGDVIPDYIILTHEHCDHLWGLNIIRDAFPDIKVIAQEKCSEAIRDPRTNKARQYHIYAVLRFGEDYKSDEAQNRSYSCRPADIVLADRYQFTWQGLKIELFHAPGHSPGSVIIEISDIGFFTGDSMMLEDDIYLKFDGGNEAFYINITQPLINAIPVNAFIFPGHGKVFQKKDWIEKRKING